MPEQQALPEGTIPIVLRDMKPVEGGQDEPIKKRVIPLSGKLVTSENALVVGVNFRTLTNMRYGDGTPKAVAGMTKINTTAISTYTKVRNMFHFRKNYRNDQ